MIIDFLLRMLLLVLMLEVLSFLCHFEVLRISAPVQRDIIDLLLFLLRLWNVFRRLMVQLACRHA